MNIMDFINQLMTNRVLIVITVLILLVIFVNGSTDAPNAIATCVSTRALTPKKAILIAVIFNFLGILVMTYFSRKVALTIFNLVDFTNDPNKASITLCSAMIGIVIWAVLAWCFGIPTSESHALIAGLSGASIALSRGLSGINFSEWITVIYGLVLTTIFGFVLGYTICKLIVLIFRNTNRIKSNNFFKKAQIVGCAGMSFMHGAQDGQKFIGVFLLGICFGQGNVQGGNFDIPIWLMIICSLMMSIGTSVGGLKIIKTVGMDMVKLESHQGFASDIAGTIGLFVLSVLGIPVSTTHMKTTAIMGVAASKNVHSVKWDIVKEMALTWILTFPGCGLIGYLITKLLLFL